MGFIKDKFGDLGNPPLVYTIFMLRFPVQTNLDEVVPFIQKSLKTEYPIFEKRSKQSIEIIQTDKGQSFNTSSIPEYLFFDGDRSKGILIKNDRIVFHSKVYPGFEEFRNWFMFASKVVIDALALTHYEGIGIRYVDAIYPVDSDCNLSDLLNQALLNFELEDDDVSQRLASTQVNHYETKEGVLILKASSLSAADVSIPPELRDLSSLLLFKEIEKKCPFYVLDFDHIFMAPDSTVIKLDLENLAGKVSRMHDISSRAFLKAINEEQIGIWK